MSIRGRNFAHKSHVRCALGRRSMPGSAAAMLVFVVFTIGLVGNALAKDRAGDSSRGSATAFVRDTAIIERLDVKNENGKTTIHAVANRPIHYFAIRQEDPPAVILNMTGAQISKPIPPYQVDNDLVGTVYVTQLGSDNSTARILITLNEDANHRVTPKADGLFIEISREDAGDKPDEEIAQRKAEVSNSVLLSAMEAVEANTLAKLDTSAKTDITVARTLLGIKVDKSTSGTQLTLNLDGTPAKIDSFKISDPHRLVVDLYRVSETNSEKKIPVGASDVTSVRVGKHPDKVRIVMDLVQDDTLYAVENDGTRVVIAFGENSKTLASSLSKKAAPVASQPSEPSVKVAKVEKSAPVVAGKEEKPSKIATPVASQPSDPAVKVAKVEKPAPVVAGKEEKPSKSATPVASQPSEPSVKVAKVEKPAPVVAAKEEKRAAKSEVVDQSNKPQVSPLKPSKPIVPQATPVMAALDGPESVISTIAPAEESVFPDRPEISLGFRPGKIYHGRLLSLDFKDAEIQNILRLIAEVSGLNIVAGDDVDGSVTVRLVNVPWDQALDVVLASRQLGYIRAGNIIRIAPAERLKAEEAQFFADRRSKEKLQDLVVKLQPVNYGSVIDAQAQVETLLSDRGSVNIDLRTNTLIIKDIPTIIDQAITLVRRLDTQTPQVLIEAKIIEANLDFAKQLGISYTADFLNADIADGENAASDNLDFGNRVVNSGTSSSGSSFFSGALPISGTPTGVVAGSFTALKEQLDIDVAIQALESSGHGRVISSPRITVLDNKEARIEQGVSIPFQTTEEGDTSLEFIDANLSLTVTPHVTNDKSIILKINVARNAPDLSVPTSTGDPAIAKNEATTEALVKNGETIVIGGIYVIDKAVNNQSIPYFNKIPGLQFLFRNYDASDKKKELIIFVTPTIVGGTV